MCLLLVAGCRDAHEARDEAQDAAAAPVDGSHDAGPPLLDAAAPDAAADATTSDAGQRPHVATIRVLGEEDVTLTHEVQGARAGDYVLENELVSFTIAGPAPHDSYQPFAGVVVGAALLDEAGLPAYDPIGEVTPQVNGCALAPDTTVVEDDGATVALRFVGREAAIPHIMNLQGTQPEPHGLALEVTYKLTPGSRALAITTVVHNPTAMDAPVAVGDLANLDSDEATAISLPHGFSFASSDASLTALGVSHETLPFSLLMHAGDVPLALPAMAPLSRVIGEDGGLWQYTFAHAMLAPGESLSRTRYLVLARDIASARTHQLAITDTPTQRITGRVSAGPPVAGARVSFFDDAAFVGQAITRADGTYEAALPLGNYHAVASAGTHGQHVKTPGRSFLLAEGMRAGPAEAFALGDEPATLDLTLTAPVAVTLRARSEGGQPVPTKFSFVAESERAAPLQAAGEREPYPNDRIAYVFWTLDGEVDAAVPPGRYRIVASRGPMAELAEQTVDLTESRSLDFTLASVAHPGWVALDSHLHAVDSQHGNATRAERVITAMAEGLDAIVNTDHDYIADYTPVLEQLAVADRLLAMPGVEHTRLDNHHHNLWPLVPARDQKRQGAVRWWEGGTLDEAYDAYAALGAQIFQINHGLQTFTDAGFDPATGLVNEGSDFSFRSNAMELQNGKRPASRAGLLPLWYGMLAHGHRIAPLGASDSHARIPEPGSARTYVWLGEEPLTQKSVVAAVAASRTVASTGPLAFVRTADGAKGPGDTLVARANEPIALHLEVVGPDWLGVTEARLVENGAVREAWPVTHDTRSRDIEITPSGDTWYALEVSGTAPLSPVYPGSTAWAHSAPLWIDVE